MAIWHPDATKQVFDASGKPWAGGSGKRKLVLHTIESNRWPTYSAPPHLTLNPNTGELRQHIPFDKAAYALRDNSSEDDRYVWQVELWGRAANTPTYDDTWYRNLAKLVAWFVTEMRVPRHYADFTVMHYGASAPQRLTPAQTDEFSGILGHGHWGRGTDTHWDPGMLDIERLDRFVGEWLEDEMVSDYIELGVPSKEAEVFKWTLAGAKGCLVDVTKPASVQLVDVGLGADPRMYQAADAVAVQNLLGLSEPPESLYKYGKEVAAIGQLAILRLMENP